MTFRSARLLSLLKTAQICEDYTIAIDFERMEAWTVFYDLPSHPIRKVDLKGYKDSIIATLDHLKNLDYIDYDYPTGQIHVTHLGWNAIKATVGSAINFTVKDILVPIAVSVLTAVVTTALLS